MEKQKENERSQEMSETGETDEPNGASDKSMTNTMNEESRGINLDEPTFRTRKGFKRKFLIDALLVSAAFIAVHLIGHGEFNLNSIEIQFIPFYLGSWLASTILSGKFKRRWRKRKRRSSFNRLARIRSYFISVLFFAGLLSLLLSGERWADLPRLEVFGALGLYCLMEILLLAGIFVGDKRREADQPKREFSSFFFLTEFLVISIGSLSLQLFKKGVIRITDRDTVLLSVCFFLWMFIGLVVHKFQIPRERFYLRAVWPFVKAMFITACIVSASIFFLRAGQLSPLIFSYLGAIAVFEILTVTLYHLYTRPKVIDQPPVKFVRPHLPEKEMIREVIAKERKDSQSYNIPNKDYESRFIRYKLEHRYLKRYPAVFNFIDHVLDLKTIDIIDAEVLDSSNPYNIEILEDNSLEFLLNLHQLNSFGRIDQYLIEVNNKLKQDGFFIGKFQPSEYRLLHLQEKYPWFLSNLVYTFDVVWRQVFPKLPILRRVYFTLSRGRNRVLPMAEGFGRLYFCGFEIVSLEEVDNHLFFIVRKAQDPYTWFKYFHDHDRVPSFGIFFKQKRVGKDMKPIYMYKVQTMHPYSEFIHRYVLEMNNLDASGKVMNDFRITSWGRVFRKLWIDELPMLINLLKGDIKLVGVRPLSQTFFNTYPEELQIARTRNKPGLIPPYYADMPKNMDEILESERRYLEQYKKHPLKTDIKYFFKAFKNIAFKGAKSG